VNARLSRVDCRTGTEITVRLPVSRAPHAADRALTATG
jgi:hypothetical protein